MSCLVCTHQNGRLHLDDIVGSESSVNILLRYMVTKYLDDMSRLLPSERWTTVGYHFGSFLEKGGKMI